MAVVTMLTDTQLGQPNGVASLDGSGNLVQSAGASSSTLDQSGSKVYAVATGTDTYAATITPGITAYSAGQAFNIKFTNANTGAATINFNGLGAKTITKNGAGALESGDILAGQLYLMVYDGTNFILEGSVGAISPEDMAGLVVERTTAFNVTGTYVEMTFGTTSVENEPNILEHNNTLTQRLEVKTTGLHQVAINLSCMNNAAQNRVLMAEMRFNGVAIKTLMFNVGKTAEELASRLTLIIPQVAGYITIAFKQQNGGSDLVLNPNTVFTIVKLQGTKGEKGDTGSGAVENDAQTVNATNSINTTSTTYIDLPNMTLTTVNTANTDYFIDLNAVISGSVGGMRASFIVNIDGVDQVGSETSLLISFGGTERNIQCKLSKTAIANAKVIKIRYKTSAGTLTVTKRQLDIYGVN